MMVHLDKLVLVSISIYSVFSYGFECPADVRPSIGACLSDYTAQLDGLRFTNKNFFTGADVELIRSICSCLQASVVCIRDISNNCDQSQRATINSLLFPHYTVVELCQYKNLFDDYAIRQNCFHKHSIETESCLNTFELSTEHTKPNDGDSSSQRLDHLRQYCSRFDALVQCVRSSLSSCGNVATTTLSELLVKATVSGSRHCKNDILNPATSSHPNQSQENNLYQNSNSAPSVNKFVEQFQFLLILCIFISCRKLLRNFC